MDTHVEWIRDRERMERPDLAGSAFELDYMRPLLEEGTTAYVVNVETEFHIVRVGKCLLPVTVNDKQYANSYVSSPYSTYVSYAKEELYLLNNRLLERALSGIIGLISPMLKLAKLNKAVHLNNWLLSTNLYEDLRREDLIELQKQLKAAYPDHAFIFRSLNERTNKELMDELAALGFRFVPSRQVYFFDGRNPAYTAKQNNVWDRRLLERSPLELVPHEGLAEADYERIKELYDLLYIAKYSALNPQFSTAYIRLCHEKKLMTMFGLRDSDGVLQGIIGCFIKNGVITAPLVGYNTALPQKTGLYRMLMAIVLQEAAKRGQLLHLSSGASHFKIMRGGMPEIEYSAVYDRHLPRYRRLPWTLLHMLLMKIGVPMMRKHQL